LTASPREGSEASLPSELNLLSLIPNTEETDRKLKPSSLIPYPWKRTSESECDCEGETPFSLRLSHHIAQKPNPAAMIVSSLGPIVPGLFPYRMKRSSIMNPFPFHFQVKPTRKEECGVEDRERASEKRIKRGRKSWNESSASPC